MTKESLNKLIPEAQLSLLTSATGRSNCSRSRFGVSLGLMSDKLNGVSFRFIRKLGIAKQSFETSRKLKKSLLIMLYVNLYVSR